MDARGDGGFGQERPDAAAMANLIRSFVGLSTDAEARAAVEDQPHLRQLEVISLLASRAEVATSKEKSDLREILLGRAAIVAGSAEPEALSLITDLVRVTYELSGLSQSKSGLAQGQAIIARAVSGDPVAECHPLIRSQFWDDVAAVAAILAPHLAEASLHAEAVALTRRALTEGGSESSAHRATIHDHLASRLLTLHDQHGGDQGVVDEALAMARQAVELTPEEGLDLPMRLTSLANCLARSAHVGGDVELYRQAIAEARRACEAAEARAVSEAVHLGGLADRLADLYRATADTDALTEALACSRSAVEAASDHVKPPLLGGLADHLALSAKEGDDPDAHRQAVQAAREAVELTAPENPLLLVRLDRLATHLIVSCGESDEPTAHDDAGDSPRAGPERRVESQFLEEAIAVSQRVAALTPDGNRLMADRFERLALLLSQRHEAGDDLESLVDAVMASRRSASGTEPTHRHYANRLSTLARLLTVVLATPGEDRALALGTTRADVIEEVLTVAQLGVDLTAEDDLALPARLGLLATAFAYAHGHRGDQEPLDLAVATAKRCVAVTPADSPALPTRLDGLAHLAAGGTRPDLELAVSASRQALASTADDETIDREWATAAGLDHARGLEGRRTMRLVRLAKRLERHHDQTGDSQTLAEAVRLAGKAVLAGTDDGPSPENRLALHRRLLEKQNDPQLVRAALERRIAERRRKLALFQPDSEQAAEQRAELAALLSELFATAGDVDALDEAISLNRREGTGDDEGRLLALAEGLESRFRLLTDVADLDAAIATMRDALAVHGDQGARRPLLESRLAAALLDRYEADGDRQHLDHAVSAALRAIEGAEPKSQELSSGRRTLDAALALLNELEPIAPDASEPEGQITADDSEGETDESEVGAIDDVAEVKPREVDEAEVGVAEVDEAEVGVAEVDEAEVEPGEVEAEVDGVEASKIENDDAEPASGGGEVVETRGPKTSAPDMAVDGSEDLAPTPEAVSTAPTAADLVNEVELLCEQFELTGERRLLDEAVSSARLAVAAADDDSQARSDGLYALSTVLNRVYVCDDDRAVLDESIAVSRRAIALTPDDSPARIRRLNNVANRLARHHAATGEVESLTEAVAMARLAVESTPTDDLEAPARLNNLANHLARLHRATGDADLVSEAVEVATKAVEASEPASPDYPSRMGNLSNHLRRLHETTNDLDALDEAIRTMTEAVANTDAGRADLPRFHGGLGECLSMRYVQGRNLVDLEAAISSFRSAAEASRPESADLGLYLDALVARLGVLIDIADREDLLAELVEAARWAVTSTPADDVQLAPRLDHLGRCLFRQHLARGDRESLLEAIEAGRRTVTISDRETTGRASYCRELSTRLSRLHEIDGDEALLSEAVEASRQAVAATPHDDADLGRCLTGLANRLAQLYASTDDRAALEEAVRVGRRALEAPAPDSLDLAARLNNQANHMARLYAVSGRRSHLEQAVDLSRRAVEAAPEPSSGLVGRLNNLANHLTRYYAETNEREGLEEARTTARRAISLGQTNGWPVPPSLEVLEGKLAELDESPLPH